MRAVAISELGATPAPMTLPVPEPGPGESRVKIIAAGLNPLDWKIADGVLKDSVAYHFPLVLGVDGAGVVDAVGEDAPFEVGDQVFGTFFGVPRGHGTYAEYTVATPDDAVIPMPEGMLYTEAAALPTPGMTAVTIIDAADVESDRVILVVGATGGVGQPVVRLASRRGATVVASARPDMEDRMRDLGAAAIVDHGEGDLNAQVREHHPDGVDAIIDLVSDRTAAERLAALLRPGGVYVSTVWALNPDALEAQGVRGVNIDYTPTPDLLRRATELAENGDLEVGVEAEIPLEEAPAAIARSRAGGARGKTIIRP